MSFPLAPQTTTVLSSWHTLVIHGNADLRFSAKESNIFVHIADADVKRFRNAWCTRRWSFIGVVCLGQTETLRHVWVSLHAHLFQYQAMPDNMKTRLHANHSVTPSTLVMLCNVSARDNLCGK